jgi:hypothetical protein
MHTVIAAGGLDTCSATEVAKAHIAAAERGRLGHNYILAGPHMSMKKFIDTIGIMLQVDTSGIHALPQWAGSFVSTLTDVYSEFFGLPEAGFTSETADLLSHDYIRLALSCQKYDC